MYDTLGRYVGGSLTVAGMMGLFVLAARARPRGAAGAARRGVGDAHRPHPADRRRPRRVVFVALALTESVPTAIIAGVVFVVYMTIENHVIQPAVSADRSI